MRGNLKLGIVGCGAIGSSLARFIRRELIRDARLTAVYDTDSGQARRLAARCAAHKPAVARNLAELCKRSDIVIESASASAAWQVVCAAADARRDCVIMSVGGIVSRAGRVAAMARRRDIRVYVPSGAVCGIDGIKAAREAGIRSVSLTTTKHPRSFKGVSYLASRGIDPDRIRKDTVLFSGPALDAVKHFPQNINVAAVLSLAGIGAARTGVVIIASPKCRRNVHEIRVESSAGVLVTRSENEPHPDNPKTSHLAFLSAASLLKQLVSPVKIGT